MDAAEALADLKQISVQIVHAVLAAQDGAVLASTLADDGSAERLARSGQELWEAADAARRELGRDELAQLEVATPGGSVFVVRDPARMIVATTVGDPTVGLVFYDLKACLRAVAEGDRGDQEPATAAVDVPATRETPAPAATAPAEAAAAPDARAAGPEEGEVDGSA